MKKFIHRIWKDEVRNLKNKLNLYRKELSNRSRMARTLSFRLHGLLFIIETRLGRPLEEEEHLVVAKEFAKEEQKHFDKIGLLIMPIYDKKNNHYTFIVGENHE